MNLNSVNGLSAVTLTIKSAFTDSVNKKNLDKTLFKDPLITPLY